MSVLSGPNRGTNSEWVDQMGVVALKLSLVLDLRSEITSCTTAQLHWPDHGTCSIASGRMTEHARPDWEQTGAVIIQLGLTIFPGCTFLFRLSHLISSSQLLDTTIYIHSVDNLIYYVYTMSLRLSFDAIDC
jgi:hypothetical protein